MRILVLSDSHGNVDNMRRCVEFVEVYLFHFSLLKEFLWGEMPGRSWV